MLLIVSMDDEFSTPRTKPLPRYAPKLTVGLLAAIVLLAIAARPGLAEIGHWLAQPPLIEQADAVVVLGGSPPRNQRGISLYMEGLASEFWHTGDVPRPGMPTTYAESRAQIAIEHGVPAEAIHLLATSSTWEDGQQIAALAKERGTRTILVVTSWPHSRRALCTIKKHLADSEVSVYYARAENPAYRPDNWWLSRAGWRTVSAEVAKIGGYWVRYGVSPWHCELP